MTVAFKEWGVVVEALLRGESCLILRKGGISEEAGAFAFAYNEFLLAPTQFHAGPDKWIWPVGRRTGGLERNQPVTFRGGCRLVSSGVLTSWEKIEQLRPFHGWSDAVLRERFEYQESGSLHWGLVRAFWIRPEWTVPWSESFGGCKSWIELPDMPTRELEMVLPESRFKEVAAEIIGLVK